jgi:hypothetical protein
MGRAPGAMMANLNLFILPLLELRQLAGAGKKGLTRPGRFQNGHPAKHQVVIQLLIEWRWGMRCSSDT